MPKQELFFEQQSAGRRVEVLKTYDTAYARDAFGKMDEAAQGNLFAALQISSNYDPAEIPRADSAEFQDFLWEEVQDAAREDGNLLSFFVVIETSGSASESLYVAPDWPRAEAFAKRRLSSLSL
jgi:hypothetical protein